MLSVVIFGYGNVGFHLYKAFQKSKDVQVLQVYSPSLKEHFKKGIHFTNTLNHIPEASLWIIALPDDVIASFSGKLPKTEAIVVHTAGSVSIQVLSNHKNKGVFYPLQSFSKNKKVDFKKIPICIEGGAKKDLKVLTSLSKVLSKNVVVISSEERLKIHLAAVWVNNFSNHLYHLANDFMDENALDFNLLLPLIKETSRKIEIMSPRTAQTGPAKRFDEKTLQLHTKLLTHTTHKELYELFTISIQEKFKTEHFGKKL